MAVFYTIVRLQKFFPLAPRRTLMPQKHDSAPGIVTALEPVSQS
jgi:hypothetical protein